MRVLSLSTLFPSPTQPALGRFVANQMRSVAEAGGVDLVMVNPVGVPPWPLSRLAAYRAPAACPPTSTLGALAVQHTRYRLIKTRCCTVMPRLARPQKQRAAAEPRQLPHRRLPFAAIQLRGALDQLQHGGLGQLVPQRARQLGEELRRHLPALLQPRGGPDRSRLTSVESFFRYTEEEGARVGGGETLLLWSDDWTPSTALLTPCFACLRSTAGKRFFEELDRDGDGRVRLEDLKLCMRCVASSPQLL